MIGYFLLGLALLGASLLLIYWFVAADPKQVVRIGKWVLVGFGIVLGLLLLFAGRLAFAALTLPALIPLFMRMRMAWRRAKSAMGPTPGQSSGISTRFLQMTLDHDSGAMTGEVLEGRFAGRSLDSLSLEEQIELWRTCRQADEQSCAVLEAYLDRVHGDAWREACEAGAADGRAAADAGAMSRDEAYEILGLEEGASEEAIREAHRRLLQKIHPDHGGSNYLAAKINQAKDLLLSA